MGQPLTVQIPHQLGKIEAQRRIDSGFDQLQKSLTGGGLNLVALERRWEGDRLHFEGKAFAQRVSGRLEVLDQVVKVELDLPNLLVAISERIKSALTGATKRLLEERR